MQKTTEQLQADLDREKAYTTKLNRQIDRLRDQLRNIISLSEHERILTSVRRECETKLSEIKIQQTRPHNERGAGRKRKATKVVIQRVMELHAEGLSQRSIAQIVSAEFECDISRTTVGEIVCVASTPPHHRTQNSPRYSIFIRMALTNHFVSAMI